MRPGPRAKSRARAWQAWVWLLPLLGGGLPNWGPAPDGTSTNPRTLWEREWGTGGYVEACATGGPHGEVLAAVTDSGQVLAWRTVRQHVPLRLGLKGGRLEAVAVDPAGKTVAAKVQA